MSIIETVVVVALGLSMLACNTPRRIAAEDIIMCQQHCHERFGPDGAPRPDMAAMLRAWEHGDRDASDRMWESIVAVEQICEAKCDTMEIGALAR